jgi:hypothetical protein
LVVDLATFWMNSVPSHRIGLEILPNPTPDNPYVRRLLDIRYLLAPRIASHGPHMVSYFAFVAEE